MTRLLLDTCAAIWLAEGSPFSVAAEVALTDATERGEAIFVSPITAWELGLLTARGRLPATVSPARWFEALVGLPLIEPAAMPPAVLIAASFLPGDPPGDPVDRIILATARELGLAVVTRDRLILSYAASGHVRAIAC